MKDFTVDTYKKLIKTLQKSGYTFLTFEEWTDRRMFGKYVILRHDIDKKPQNALLFAKLEHDLGIKSTYYFLENKTVFDVDIIEQINALGHEIGYHYRDLADARGDKAKAIKLFEKNLKKFRKIVPVNTISMDGCPWSVYDNRNLWEDCDYKNWEIKAEPYFDFLSEENKDKVLYFTDTARMWDGDKYNLRDKSPLMSNQIKIHSSFDFMEWIRQNKENKTIMITTHPQRWNDKHYSWYKEFISQSLKNKLKYLLIKIRKRS